MKFKKMLSLLTAAAMSVSCFAGLSISAGAATASEYIPGTTDTSETVYSAGDTILDDDNITITVTAAVTVSTTTDSNFLPATYPYNLPFRNGSTGYTDILVTPKVGGTFTATVGINANKTMYIKENSTSGTEIAKETPTVKAPNTISAELEAGKTYIVYAAGTGAALLKVNFEPEEASETKYTTIYDFTQLASAIEGTTGTFAPTTAEEGSNAPDIQIDATTGKFGPNGSWPQFTTGAKLTIPDVPAGAVVKVTPYSGTVIDINETQYTGTSQEVTYTATKLEDVVITCVDGGYIGSTLTVVGKAFGTETETPEETTTTTTIVKAAQMTAIGNSNGSPYLYTDKTLTPDETSYVGSEYEQIFGVDFANAGTDKYGYLGDTSRGYVTTDFTTTADGPCTLYVLGSYGRSSNLITVTNKSTDEAVVDAQSPQSNLKVGVNTTDAQDLYIYTYTIASLTAGTYTFKWHSAGAATDL
ncbi:MAG: hypothetical protein ACI4EA_03275, partial [Candidatus Ornithomonoglobus sp.]